MIHHKKKGDRGNQRETEEGTAWNMFGSNFSYNNHSQLPEEMFFSELLLSLTKC
jgi:hypothetical protein